MCRVRKYEIRILPGGGQSSNPGEVFGEPLVAQVSMVDGSDPGDASAVFTVLGGKALSGGTK